MEFKQFIRMRDMGTASGCLMMCPLNGAGVWTRESGG
jgi:hypothetical protein